MFVSCGLIIEKGFRSGVTEVMSANQQSSGFRAASAYVYAHPVSDPTLDDKRFTTSTEHILDYKGRKVLYCYNEASAISFCSAAGANYAGNMVVKGYVVRWKYGANESGEALSEIEPVVERNEQEEISRILWPGMNSIARVSFS